MAQIIGRGAGTPKQRRPVEERRQRHLPESEAAADAVGRILLSHHGEQEWIFQIMEAVRAAVTNGVSRFTSAQLPATNETPDGHYRFPARTREEILSSQREAASAGEVNPRSAPAHLMDPAEDLGAPPAAMVNGNGFEQTQTDEERRQIEREWEARSRKIIVPSSDEWAL